MQNICIFTVVYWYSLPARGGAQGLVVAVNQVMKFALEAIVVHEKPHTTARLTPCTTL